MTILKTTIITTLAAISIVASAAAAFATPAVATAAVNVRSGPATSHGVVDTLLPGENVEVTECVANGWCYVQHNGPNGWVSSNYLGATAPAPAAPAPSNDPDVNIGFGIDSDGNFSIGFGIGGAPVFPTAPVATPDPIQPKVCFYKKKNYKGASFCVSPGSSDNQLSGNWDNKISSIKLIDGASVEVCKGNHYTGFCKTFGSSVNSFNPFLNNKISSFKAF